ncbi:MAG: Bifunctional ligase/repressor BirA [Verrucomicrobiae bacterium]|nr:Bifunctional ligase/repressor BirA [Verrucomicrobiae bacterium]
MNLTEALAQLYRHEYVTKLPAAVLAELRQLGYVVEQRAHLGYRLVESPDRLIADDLRARLKTQMIGKEILVFEETASTNDVVARLADGHRGEGLVVFAESQTKGRGRHGRVWSSPRGKGLWFSVLLRPRFPLTRLTVAASVAVARVAGKEARIKWPNDVTLHGRKLAGILTEARDGVAILGIGVNVNCQAKDLPAELHATSLVTEDRPGLAAELLQELDELYRQADEDFARISTEWARLCTTVGKQIAIRMGDRRIEGHAQALDEDGALLIRRDSGKIERIVGADLTLERE